MRLKRLSLKNFLCHEELDAEFTRPVNLIVGQNEVGKTALRDSIDYVFRGMARGIPYKKDAHALTRQGATSMAVELVIENPNMTIRRTAKQVSPGQRDIDKVFDPNVLGACLDAFSFLRKSRDDRRKILASFSQANPAEVEAALREAGLEGDALREFTAMAIEDLGRAERAAVERRRAAKRLKEAGTQEPAKTVEVGGKTYHLAKIAAAKDKLYNRISQLQQDEGRLLMARGTVTSQESLQQELASITTRLRALESDLTVTNKATLKASQKSVADSQADYSGKATKLDAFELVVQAAGEACVACELVTCPLDKGESEEALGIYREGVEYTKKCLDETRAEHEKLIQQDSQAQEIVRIHDRRKEIEAELAKAQTFEGEEALQSVREKLELNRELKGHMKAWEQAKAARERAAAEAGKAADEILLWDKVVRVCDKKGPIQKLLAGRVVPDMVTLARKSKLFAEERTLSIESNGAVVLDGIPSEFLSRSASFRIGVLVGHCLATLAGFRCMVLDEADVLTPPNRKLLFEFLGSVRDDYDTIIVLASEGDRPPRPSPADWLQVWRLDKGLHVVEE